MKSKTINPLVLGLAALAVLGCNQNTAPAPVVEPAPQAVPPPAPEPPPPEPSPPVEPTPAPTP
jgi:hypothetical protein